MVKIVNGVIVSDSEHAELMGGSNHNSSSTFGSSGSGADFDLTVNICSYKFNKWMIMGVIFVMTLIMGFKGLLLSCLVFFGNIIFKMNFQGIIPVTIPTIMNSRIFNKWAYTRKQ